MMSPASINTIQRNPLRLHVLVFSSYFDNWRWYLKDLGDQFSKMEDKAMTIDIRNRAHYDISFDTLQSLRHVEEKVVPLGALFRATVEIVDTIAKADAQRRLESQDVTSGNLTDCLASYTSQCRGHIASEEILQKRIRGILELVCGFMN